MSLTLIDAACQVSITWALIMFTCALWYYSHRNTRNKNLPPGSLGWPIIGETISLANKKADFFREKRQKFGDVYKTHLMMRPTIRVSGAEYVQKVLKGENKIVVSYAPKSVRTLFGSGALSQSHGIEHVHEKRTFMQSITGQNLGSYIQHVAGLVENATSAWTCCKDVGLLSSVEKLSLGSVLSIFYGNRLSSKDVDFIAQPANAIVDNLLSVPINISGTNYNKALEARSQLVSFVKTFISKLLASGDIGSCTPLLRSILGVDANNYGEENLLNNRELMTKLTDCNIELIVSGRSTLYSSVVNSILTLKKHPHVLERFREELVEHSMNNPKTSPLAAVTLDQLKSLTYLDKIVKEILRLFPAVGGGFRVALEPFELAGYNIPKNWGVTFSIRETHEFQNIPNCSQFDPDRWDENNGRRPDRERFAYIPFGAGARSCPGKEFAKMMIKLTLVHLCRSCDWEVLEDYEMNHYPLPIPSKDVRIRFNARQLPVAGL